MLKRTNGRLPSSVLSQIIVLSHLSFSRLSSYSQFQHKCPTLVISSLLAAVLCVDQSLFSANYKIFFFPSHFSICNLCICLHISKGILYIASHDMFSEILQNHTRGVLSVTRPSLSLPLKLLLAPSSLVKASDIFFQ